MNSFGMSWEMGACLGTDLDEDGYPVAQFDSHGEDPRTESFELHHTFGFASRPRDPEKDQDGQILDGKACNMWRATEGNTLHGVLGFDPRYIATFPKLEKGGSMQYCAAGSFIVMDGDDGTITEYVPVPGDKAHVFTRGVDGNGDPYIGLEHSSGMAVLMLGDSMTLKNKTGSVYIELKSDHVVVNGNMVANGGLTAGSPAGALPAAVAPKLAAYLTQLEIDIATALAAIGVGPAAAGPAGAASFAGTAAVRAALSALIPAQNVSIF